MVTEIIRNAYQWRKALYQDVVAAFVNSFMVGKDYLTHTTDFRQCVSPTK